MGTALCRCFLEREAYMCKRFLMVCGLGLGLVALLAVLYIVNPGEGRGFIPCPVYLTTRLYCPGCGMARAVHSLLHLDIYQALRFNVLGVILLLPAGVYVAARAVDYVRTGGNHIDRHLSPALLWCILVAVLLYGVLRNIPVMPFAWLAPTVVG